jgi:hypothetical protein
LLSGKLPAGTDADPNDSTQCDGVCAYLRRLLGPTGTASLLGSVDTRDAKVIKFKLQGDIVDATIPLNEAGAELEDFGLLFKLEIPKKKVTSRRARSLPAFRLEGGGAAAAAATTTATTLAPAVVVRSHNDTEGTTQFVSVAELEAMARERRQGGGQPCAIDLMVLMDASGSIRGGNCGTGLKCFDALKGFVRDVVSTLNVGTGPLDARVGLVTFNENQKVIFDLAEHDTNQDVERALMGLRTQPTGRTYTRKGMEKLRKTLIKESFNRAAASSDRQTPKRLVLVLTDGGYTGRVKGKVGCWQNGVYRCVRPEVADNRHLLIGTPARTHPNNPAPVAKDIVELDGIPIYAIGVNIPRENGVSPVGR